MASSFDSTNERFEAFAPALFVVGAMLAVLPFTEVMLGVYPFRADNVMWRFGAVGILSSGLGSFPVGVLLLLAGAWLKGSRALMRTVAIISVLFCAILLLLSPLFALDSIQVLNRVKPEEKKRVTITWLLALVKLLTLSAALGTIGYVGFRASKRPPKQPARARERTAATPQLLSPLAAPRPTPTPQADPTTNP